MIIDTGDTVLVSHRRLFDGDEPRFFVGRTIACDGPLIKAEGYSFVRDSSTGHIIKKDERRTKILSLYSPAQIVYQLPGGLDLELIDVVSQSSETVLVAGPRQIMNLSEHTHSGRFRNPVGSSFFG